MSRFSISMATTCLIVPHGPRAPCWPELRFLHSEFLCIGNMRLQHSADRGWCHSHFTDCEAVPFCYGATAEGNGGISISLRVLGAKGFLLLSSWLVAGWKKAFGPTNCASEWDVLGHDCWVSRKDGEAGWCVPDKNGKTRGNNTWKDCWGARVPGNYGRDTVWFVDLPTDPKHFSSEETLDCYAAACEVVAFPSSFFQSQSVVNVFYRLELIQLLLPTMIQYEMVFYKTDHILNCCLKMFLQTMLAFKRSCWKTTETAAELVSRPYLVLWGYFRKLEETLSKTSNNSSSTSVAKNMGTDLILWTKAEMEESVVCHCCCCYVVAISQEARSMNYHCGLCFNVFHFTNSIKLKRLISYQYLQIIWGQARAAVAQCLALTQKWLNCLTCGPQWV